MKYLLCTFFFAATFSLAAQSFEWTAKSAPETVSPVANQAAYEKAYSERQVGMAGTYYGNYDGRPTAYGETFRSANMTASHRLLPLGTLLQVINLDNGRRATVRVNDRGQECADCLIQLSSTAAASIGIQGYGQVSVERVGFSNWNPAPPAKAAPSPAVTYRNPAPMNGRVSPVTVGGNTTGWTPRGAVTTQQAPTAYGSTPTYQQNATPTPGTVRPGNVAVLSAPSVLSREVDPATRANQPATFSRRPTVVPQAQQTTVPQYTPPAATVQTYRAPQTYQAPTYQQPPAYQPENRYTTPRPVQLSPGQVTPQQAAPPQPTVQRFQSRGGTVRPQSYGQQPTKTNSYQAAPAAYAAVPQPKAVTPLATNTAPAPAPAASPTGFAVQLGAYNNAVYAQNRVNQLKASGLDNVFYVAATKADGQVINRVYAGTFSSMADAQVASIDIRNDYQIAGIVTKM